MAWRRSGGEQDLVAVRRPDAAIGKQRAGLLHREQPEGARVDIGDDCRNGAAGQACLGKERDAASVWRPVRVPGGAKVPRGQPLLTTSIRIDGVDDRTVQRGAEAREYDLAVNPANLRVSR